MPIDYKQKLTEMSLHRQNYIEVIDRALALYSEMKGKREIRNLIDEPWISLLLELIDLEYLDSEVYTIEKSFGSVVAVYYNGHYPLTNEGKAFLHTMGVEKNTGKIKVLLAAILVAAAALLVVYLL